VVDEAPSKVKEGISQDEAKAAVEKLQEVGAQVEIK
jgi:ribosomal protein L7/L12